MVRTVQAVINKDGEVHLIEPIRLDGEHRAIVMIMDELPAKSPAEPPAELPVLACSSSLAEWNLPEEDIAWMHLQ